MLITIKVAPRAHQNAIISYENEILKVRLHAIPEKGEANEELIEFLADVFNLSKSSITIVRGHTSRLKHVEIQGLTKTQLKKYCP
jgi:uncharacterized protein (TIGR00251 family)